MSTPDSAASGNDDAGRDDGDLSEDFDVFLAGVRTSLPGIQVLVAFLLVLPLQAGFGETDDVERGVFLGSFIASVIGAGLLIAPSVHQRVRAPVSGISRGSAEHVATAVWMTIVGTVLTSTALIGVTFLATSFVFAHAVALTVASVVGVVLGVTWYLVPLRWGR